MILLCYVSLENQLNYRKQHWIWDTVASTIYSEKLRKCEPFSSLEFWFLFSFNTYTFVKCNRFSIRLPFTALKEINLNYSFSDYSLGFLDLFLWTSDLIRLNFRDYWCGIYLRFNFSMKRSRKDFSLVNIEATKQGLRYQSNTWILVIQTCFNLIQIMGKSVILMKS